MRIVWSLFSFALATSFFVASSPAVAQAQPGSPTGQAATQRHLVSAAWLATQLGRPDLLILDASPTSLHKKQHLPGAVNASGIETGLQEIPQPAYQQRVRAWGLNPGQKVVIYDQGGTYFATRLFWDLVYQGVPAQQLAILDGGMAKWLAQGGAVTAEVTVPRVGTLQLAAQNPAQRVRLPEFLVATGDPQRVVTLDALDPPYYYGGAAFFNRGGHMPHAKLMPSDDFFDADKTFKSPQEIERMLRHLGIGREQQILTYCGGGGAAAVPTFFLKYVLDYPEVKMFAESQRGWLEDERELPVWTFAAPHVLRDTPWLKSWGSPFFRAVGIGKVSIVDVRSADDFKLGHVPLAVNLPAAEFARHRQDLGQLRTALLHAGVNPAHEAVVVSEGGINEQSALAYLLLDRLGQPRVSIHLDSLERWVEQGQQVARPAAAAAPSPSAAPARPAAQAKAYPATTRDHVSFNDQPAAANALPRIYIASGAKLPTKLPASAQGQTVLHLPYAQFLGAGGRPKAAHEIWQILDKAGVPRYAQHVLVADAAGEAAVNYLVFKLMGLADLKVWSP